MADTKLEWTDRVWNPFRGCRRVSPGCENCYAEKIAGRWSRAGAPYHGVVTLSQRSGEARWNGEAVVVQHLIGEPFRWGKKPLRCFVNSMSDLFYDGFSFVDIAAVFGVMAATPHITYQVLTKRAWRMRQWFLAYQGARECLEEAKRLLGKDATPKELAALDAVPRDIWPLPNVWLGCSVEDQQRADERMPDLVQTPAHVRFVSQEPQLTAVSYGIDLGATTNCFGLLSCATCYGRGSVSKGTYDLDGWRVEQECPAPGCLNGLAIHQVILGGESGTGARPCDLTGMSATAQQLKSAGVKVFVKQAGSAPMIRTDGGELVPVKLLHRKGADLREVPSVLGLHLREFPDGE